jgi:hypothetical protein
MIAQPPPLGGTTGAGQMRGRDKATYVQRGAKAQRNSIVGCDGVRGGRCANQLAFGSAVRGR